MSGIRSLSTIAIALGVGVFSSATLAQSQHSKLAKLDQRVQNIYKLAMKGICEVLEPDSKLRPGIPEIYEFTFNYGDEDYPPRPFRLYQLPCTMGAYNFGSVFYSAIDYDEIRQIQFAEPVFDIVRESEEFDSAVTSINVTGFTAYGILTNPDFDPETKTITSFSKWRGAGDASSSGTWVFDGGRFVLESYDVDASYNDGANPIRIYGTGEAEPQ